MVIPVKNFNFLKIEDNETKLQIFAVARNYVWEKSSDQRRIKITTMRCLINTGIQSTIICVTVKIILQMKNFCLNVSPKRKLLKFQNLIPPHTVHCQ